MPVYCMLDAMEHGVRQNSLWKVVQQMGEAMDKRVDVLDFGRLTRTALLVERRASWSR